MCYILKKKTVVAWSGRDFKLISPHCNMYWLWYIFVTIITPLKLYIWIGDAVFCLLAIYLYYGHHIVSSLYGDY